MAVIRVAVVDDQNLLCQSLARVLDGLEGISIVGLAGDGKQAIKVAEEVMPDVILMDIRMPVMDGIAATRTIRSRVPSVKVLLLTGYESDESLFEGLKAGAVGYVLKDASPEELVEAIQAVAAGESAIGPEVAHKMLDVFMRLGRQSEEAPLYDGLTFREVEILKLVAAGLSSKDIAMQLGISDKTVRNHISNTYQKLHIYDRGQAVLYALRRGLIQVD